jgi:replication initiator protein RepSA
MTRSRSQAWSSHLRPSGPCSQLEHLHLTAWAHMLGFNGHFSTKSRTYSTTLGALRADAMGGRAGDTRRHRA